MPYIHDENMKVILRPVNIARNQGELNYQIFMTMMAYLMSQDVPFTYTEISGVLSACHEAEQEFRRRVLVPLEEWKIEENGDILPKALVELLASTAPTETPLV